MAAEALGMFWLGILLGLGFGASITVQWIIPPVRDNWEKYYEQKLINILREAGKEQER